MNYKLDLAKRTLTITKDFEKKLNDIGSDEYNLVKQIQHDFPNIVIVKKKRTASPKAKVNKNLTYENMRKFILTYDNHDQLLDDFETVKSLSAPQKNPYLFVKNWFLKQFPDYQKMPKISEEGFLIAIPILAKFIEEIESSNTKTIQNIA